MAAQQQGEVAVALFADSEGRQPLPGSLLNADAWRPGSMLQVGAARFAIAYNPPTVDKVGAPCLTAQWHGVLLCAWMTWEGLLSMRRSACLACPWWAIPSAQQYRCALHTPVMLYPMPCQQHAQGL